MTRSSPSIQPPRFVFIVRRVAILLLLSLSPGAFCPVASAQPATNPQDEGRQRFKRGIDLFKEGDFRAALVEFKRAYETAPSYRILYNLGQTSYELQDYAGALQAFERYLKEGGTEIPPERRSEVEIEIKKLQGRVALLTIEVNEVGVQISVDDVQVGISPLPQPILVSAGQRRISASKMSLLPVSQVIELAGGDQRTLHLELINPGSNPTLVPSTTPPPSSTPSDPPPPPSPPPAPPSNDGFWIGLGATILFTGGAIGTGLVAHSAEGERDKELKRFPGNASKLKEQANRAKTFALTSDILSGLALVGAGVTVYFSVRSGGGTTAARVTPGGASLALTF